MMSLPAVKAVSIGSGFDAIDYTGLTHNDPFEWQDGACAPQRIVRAGSRRY